ncbi:DUF1223 domain-containing protein [Marivibrio halodurans]|uniref:DUF1223 domain-containing protein n=1 Tax=Marivibrio halodurans TaxID=2039722 RepID=A0A8J7S858_9PROT|nr:DUF1223 domain-containing protein [Marivibrio halodurans]MBP5858624.1 DUF1223 domain-containing protein [Marivibrio halodurans]
MLQCMIRFARKNRPPSSPAAAARMFPVPSLFLALFLAAIQPSAAKPATTQPNIGKGDAPSGPVAVELFTSQGCSSCPPTEDFLAELAGRPGVIALEFHVDYWDYIGWKDPFADPAFTARQRAYARALDQPYVYTPQIVIDGADHAVGSRRDAVEARMAAARRRHDLSRAEGTAPDLSLDLVAGRGYRIRVDGPGPAPGESFRLLLIGFDRRHATRVGAGENRGRTLESAHIVRALVPLGPWTGGRLSRIVPADSVTGDGGVAVFLQDGAAGPIAAAAMIRF